MKRRILIIGFLISFSGVAIATENVFDPSKPMVCAMVEVQDCGISDQCARINPQDVNLPDIFRVDIKKKELGGAARQTQIKHTVHNDGSIILQGNSPNDRAWSMLLSKDSGKFTGAVAGVDYGFLIFGSCISD